LYCIGSLNFLTHLAFFITSYGIFPLFFSHQYYLHYTDATGDVFFSPSTTEGFPLVFLESMASGTPVVGANEGGTPLTFEHRQHGIHFPSHDQDAAVQAVLDVLDAGETMKQACVPHARTFTWERAINDLEGKYFKVLSRASKF
jgi:glycosyltransferase involved in cell wall biosynthesis